MLLALRAAERTELEQALRETRRVREWKRYRTIVLRAEGLPLAAIAQTLGVSAASVSVWIHRWRKGGRVAVTEGVHPGLARRFASGGGVAGASAADRSPGARVCVNGVDRSDAAGGSG